ncbi:hypothetical protein I552_2632 [Mycobacterium xenopi 3993]|nr:hypothetical protein I552_2632 [Mycobacterium xenopi 3993]
MPPSPRPAPAAGVGVGLLRLRFGGVGFGALFFCLSLTPSLLPRDWLFQGLIGGINAAFGYGLGVLLEKAAQRFVLRNARWWPPPAGCCSGSRRLSS